MNMPGVELHGPTEWTCSVSDGVLIRIATLAASDVEMAGTAEIIAALARSTALDADLHQTAAQLCDALYDTIRAVPANEPDRRNFLIHLKRDIFNGRDLDTSDLEWAERYLSGDVRKLFSLRQQLRARLVHHDGAMEDELAALKHLQRRKFQELAARSDFRKGLQTASPSFARALEAYLAWDGGPLDRGQRRSELVLLHYLFRTSHKTSPFSRLTTLALARFDDACETAMVPELGPFALKSVVKPNLAVAARIHDAVRRNVARFPDLRLCLQDCASLQPGRIKYHRRSETPWREGPVHGQVVEAAYELKRSVSLDHLCRLLADGRVMSVADLARALADDMNGSEARSYLAILVENGLLVAPGLRQSVFDAQCWDRFEEEVLHLHGAPAAKIIDALRAVRTCAAGYGEADAAAREISLAHAEARLNDALQEIDPQGRAPKPLLYEDTCIATTPIVLPRRSWRTLIAELAELQRPLSLSDPLLVSRAMLKAHFKTRFGEGGECRDIAAFALEFHDVFYRTFVATSRDGSDSSLLAQSMLNAARVPEVAAVDREQKRFQRYLRDCLNDGSTAEIALAPAVMASFGTEVTRLVPFLSNAFAVQVWTEGGRPRAVLNSIFAGAGAWFSRFEDLFRHGAANPIHDLLVANLSALPTEHCLVAEFQGGYETSLNQHTLTTAAEIVLPGERAITSRPLLLSELRLRHRADADVLVLECDRLGTRVIPVYLGQFFALGLPILQSFLLHFTAPFGLPSGPVRTMLGGVRPTRMPRLSYKDVVIERASWTMPVAAVPVRGRQEGDYAFLRRLDAWREQAGVPRRSFVRVMRSSRGADATETATEGEMRAKPFFIDFANPFCAHVLEKQVGAGHGTIEISEVLPDPIESAVRCSGAPHVTEFVVEITHGGGYA